LTRQNQSRLMMYELFLRTLLRRRNRGYLN
jgi:hypothetical protein